MKGACLVLDVGSGTIKGGFGGTEQPVVYRNVVGDLKYSHAIAMGDVEGAVSNDIDKHRGLFRLSYPICSGHVSDWESLSRVLGHVSGSLGVGTKDHPLLVTEAAFTSKPQRSRLAQVLFEEFQHPALMFANQGLLALYASGTTTGIVLDVGDGVTQTCPVFEGYSIREAARRADFGGRDMTRYLQGLLRQYGTFLDTTAEVDIVRTIKEQRCHVSTTSTVNESSAKIRHKLPDGTEIQLGSEVAQASEALFNPALVGSECSGVVSVVSESIKLTDIDLRRDIYQNIILAGGSTLTQGFCSRFLTDMTKLTPRDCRVRILAPAERQCSAWIGGSFLSQLSTFRQMLIQRSDYLEQGERIVHAKLFC